MKVLFSIGHFSIYMFGAFIALGMLLGYVVAMREGKRKGFNEDNLISIIFVSIISGVMGARLYYIFAFNPSHYLSNPLDIIAFRSGGLSIQGALIGGVLGALVYAKFKKINILKVADIMAPGIILGQAIGRIGCDVFGIEMGGNYLWGIPLNGQLFHPAQVYEAILNFILFGVLWSKRKNIKYDGQLFVIYIIGFSINRFIVEFFRTNPIVIGSLTIAHVTSVLIILLTLLGSLIIKRKADITPSSKGVLFDISVVELSVILLTSITFISIYYLIWL